MAETDLDKLVDKMLSRRVVRLRTGDVEIELHASAFAAAAPLPDAVPAPSALSAPEGDVCVCGHSWGIEHVPSGCIHGCSLELCSTPANQPPKEA